MYFHHLQVVENNSIDLPLTLRAQMSLLNRIREYLTIQSLSSDSKVCELLLSPIRFEKRQDIWLLKAHFNDRRGLIAEVTEFLESINVDVITFKSCVIENGQILFIEVLIDTIHYSSKVDKETIGKHIIRKFGLATFKSVFVAEFIRDIRFNPDTEEPEIGLDKNYNLSRSVNMSISREEIEINNSRIAIPDEMMQKIVRMLDRKNTSSGKNEMLASVVSDPYNNLFRIFLFYRNTGIIHIRIKARNKSGVITAITKLLKKQGFNITQFFFRCVQIEGDTNEYILTDCILSLPDDELKLKEDDNEIIRSIINQFSESTPDLKKFNWQVVKPRLLEGFDVFVDRNKGQ